MNNTKLTEEIWNRRGTPIFTDEFCFGHVGMGKSLADLMCKNDQERRKFILGEFPLGPN